MVRLTTLAQGSAIGRGRVEAVTLLGSGSLKFRRTDKALEVSLPEGSRGAPVRVLKIIGDGLTG